MEVLSRALAARVPRLHLEHAVVGLDVDRRIVHVRTPAGPRRFHYRQACLATLPLPDLVAACAAAPAELRTDCSGLARNRAWSAAFCVRGPRPAGRGHWRYFADESVVFNRLVHLHEFDPDSAPPASWPLLAEITEPASSAPPDPAALLARVRRDLERAGALPAGSTITAERLLLADPAYVVFTAATAPTVRRATAWLRAHDVEPLGRYGRWEYSSMGQVVRDGYAAAETLLYDRGGRR
jgi:hypothetical protein